MIRIPLPAAAVLVGTALATAAEPPKREALYHESLRPQFHFTARYWDNYMLHPPHHHEGWMNDMNGLVYNDGEYHFFAQRWWSAWLHAVSSDLIHWQELKPAFGKGGEFGGTQSGGCVVDQSQQLGSRRWRNPANDRVLEQHGQPEPMHLLQPRPRPVMDEV